MIKASVSKSLSRSNQILMTDLFFFCFLKAMTDLSCVWIDWKPISEIIFCKIHVFNSYGKQIFRKNLPKFYIIDSKIILHCCFTFKRFSEKAQKRETPTERKNPCKQNTLSAREREQSTSTAIVITVTAPISVNRDRDQRFARSRAISRSRSVRLRSRSRRSRAIAIDASRDRNLTEKMWSFLGFICVFRNEWYYVFVW